MQQSFSHVYVLFKLLFKKSINSQAHKHRHISNLANKFKCNVALYIFLIKTFLNILISGVYLKTLMNLSGQKYRHTFMNRPLFF